MTHIAQALLEAQSRGLDRLDAQLLLLHALSRATHDRAWLLAHDTDTLPAPVQTTFGALVQRRPDLIVTSSTATVGAIMKATSTIPIVFYGIGDPVGSGLVVSLARPGGNVTGIGGLAVGAYAKQLELLAEAVPGARRIGAARIEGSVTRRTFRLNRSPSDQPVSS